MGRRKSGRAEVLSPATRICLSSGNQKEDVRCSPHHCSRLAADSAFPLLLTGEAVRPLLMAPGSTSASRPTEPAKHTLLYRGAQLSNPWVLGRRPLLDCGAGRVEGGLPSLRSCTQEQPSLREPGLHACQRQTLLDCANSALTETAAPVGTSPLQA